MTIIEQILFWIQVEPMDFMLTVLISLMLWNVLEVSIYEIIEEKKNKKEDDIM